MDNFDIVTALNDYATSKGWHFIFYVSTPTQELAEVNIQTTKEYIDGELILAVAVSATPQVVGSVVDNVRYECLMMLGRKFDPNPTPNNEDINGSVSNLDETDKQKYDRRLGFLLQTLSESVADFGCQNGLRNVSSGNITFAKNMLDENIDFAVSRNATFTQDISYGN